MVKKIDIKLILWVPKKSLLLLLKKITVLIKKIPVKETFPIKRKVLKKKIRKPYFSYKIDNETHSFHLGKYINKHIVGTISVEANTLENNWNTHKIEGNIPNFGSKEYELKAMAVLEAFQNQGIGKELFEFSEIILKDLQVDYIWCNAQKKYLYFYKNQGFEKLSDGFFIPNLGIHYVLGKRL